MDSHVAAPPTPTFGRAWAEAFLELSIPVKPVRAPSPRLLALNDEVAEELGWDPEGLRTEQGIRLLTGSAPSGGEPVAQVYAGHQWGVFTPILGDGRAALLGERVDGVGRPRDVHLKGIGPTPLSRVDGFATVGPMLREYLFGEAMHALGVPTTRALAVVATGAPRTLDGITLPGAVLARTARSHIRFGTFEYAHAKGDVGLLRRLADHVTARHYPEAARERHPHLALLDAIVDASAALVARWMSVGFVHGVLSTDNVLVGAETIDYGPCAFLDAYEPSAWFSSIDRDGRYAYARQPDIMRWNLERLGDAFAPLLSGDPARAAEVAAGSVAAFDRRYEVHRAAAYRAKLGLGERVPDAEITALADAALALLEERGVDYTGFWRDLAAAADGDERVVRGRFLGPVPGLDDWLARWTALAPDAAAIRAANPVYIPRNHLVEEALAAAVAGDLAPFDHLLGILRDPFTERTDAAYRRFALAAPDDTGRHVTFCGT